MSNRRRPLRPDLAIELQEFHLVDDVDTALQDLNTMFRCPDCNSTFGEPVRYGDQFASVQVQHDPTCPWLWAWFG